MLPIRNDEKHFTRYVTLPICVCTNFYACLHYNDKYFFVYFYFHLDFQNNSKKKKSQQCNRNTSLRRTTYFVALEGYTLTYNKE
jgi:hypothetical protein